MTGARPRVGVSSSLLGQTYLAPFPAGLQLRHAL
jgi:hypothetical protein